MKREANKEYRNKIQYMLWNEKRKAAGLPPSDSFEYIKEISAKYEELRKKINPIFSYKYPGLFEDSDEDEMTPRSKEKHIEWRIQSLMKILESE